MTVNRRLVAVVVADVVGYSRLMERDEAGTHERLRKLKAELIDPKIAEHGGRIVKTSGDGMLVEFPSATSALRCGVEIQREMGVRNLYVAPDDKIQFRVGINLGDIIVEGDDILGDGVNVAARLETLAEPGGICVASAVWEQVHEDLGVEFVDSGEQHVKNITKPIRVFRVALGKGPAAKVETASVATAATVERWPALRKTWLWPAVAVATIVIAASAIAVYWRTTVPSAVADRPTGDAPLRSVMIVPFTSAQGDAELAAEAARLSADVTRALGDSVPEARVAPPGVAAALAAKTTDLRAMAREANVRFVVDGELRTSAAELVATLRLFDARDGKQLQMDRRSIERARLADDHEAFVRQLTSATRVMFGEALAKAMPKASDAPASAQDFVDRSFNVNISDQVANAKETRKLVDEAIRRDPNLAIAWAQRAAASMTLFENDFTVDRERVLSEADADSLRAVTLDGRDPLAWTVRSRVLGARGYLEAALAANDRAQQLDPTRFYPMLIRGWIYVAAGKHVDALKLTDALRAPMASDSGLWVISCAAQMQAGAYDLAISACERAAAGGEDWITYASLAAAYAMRGDASKAAQAKTKLLAIAPAFTISRYQAKGYFTDVDAVARDRDHMIAGLRKAGVPE